MWKKFVSNLLSSHLTCQLWLFQWQHIFFKVNVFFSPFNSCTKMYGVFIHLSEHEHIHQTTYNLQENMTNNEKQSERHLESLSRRKKTRSCLRVNLSCWYCMYPSTAASRFVYFSSPLLLRKKSNIIMYIPRSTDIIPTKSRNKIIRKRTGSLQQCDND